MEPVSEQALISFFLLGLGCENAGLVLIECQNGHLVILDLNSLIWM